MADPNLQGPVPGVPSPGDAVPHVVPEVEVKARAGEVEMPAKVLRIGSMVRQLLEEVRRAPLDEASRARLAEIHETSVKELSESLSEDLQEELARLNLPFQQEAPTEAELRVAQAQLVGWLEGLFHGIQATLFAQQMAARAQLEELHRRSLPRPGEAEGTRPPGTYL
jgi:Bacterial proteasome activator